jgi:hypothetical protein
MSAVAILAQATSMAGFDGCCGSFAQFWDARELGWEGEGGASTKREPPESTHMESRATHVVPPVRVDRGNAGQQNAVVVRLDEAQDSRQVVHVHSLSKSVPRLDEGRSIFGLLGQNAGRSLGFGVRGSGMGRRGGGEREKEEDEQQGSDEGERDHERSLRGGGGEWGGWGLFVLRDGEAREQDGGAFSVFLEMYLFQVYGGRCRR